MADSLWVCRQAKSEVALDSICNHCCALQAENREIELREAQPADNNAKN